VSIVKSNSELPQGWIITPIWEAYNFVKTGVRYYNGMIEYYSTGSIQKNNIYAEGRVSFDNRPSRANRLSKKGDVFQARMYGTDKSFFVDNRMENKLFSTGFIQLRPYIHFEGATKYLFYLIQSRLFLDQRDKYATGTTQVALTDTESKKIEVPIAPANKQLRIVTKIEELFTKLDVGLEALKQILVQLKSYRQAVLKAAVEGRLTAEWREGHLPASLSSAQTGKDELEPANKLLERILKERRAKWEAEHIAKYEAHGKNPPKGWGNRYKEPSQPDITHLPELPDEWGWTTLGCISHKIQIGPFGTQLHKSDYVEGGIPLINPQHIKHQKIFPDNNLTVPANKYDELHNYVLRKGDIILGRRGEMGRSSPISQKEDGWLCGTGRVLIRLFKGFNSALYSHILSSYTIKKFLQSESIGTTMNNLNLKILNSMPIPILSNDEQSEILQKIDKHFSICEYLEKETCSNLRKTESLRQSILKRAFEGKLVRQDPNDLPAPRPGKYFIYVLECSNGSHYIGHTENIEKRWCDHAGGRGADWTRKYPPIALVHWEEYNSRADAAKREKELKTGFGRKWIKREIKAGRARQAGEPASVLLEKIKAKKTEPKKSKQLEIF